ncbi:hypothetical protein HQ533_06005 [Candidatus Woesearchaeota archaeon]|nr:hypothetical protein [Candidatus Woesearchaeota archaeon]
MKRIVNGLFSKRNKDISEKRTKDLLSGNQLINVCRLMSSYGLNVFSGMGGISLGQNEFTSSEIFYNPISDFIDKAKYKIEDNYMLPINDLPGVVKYFISSTINSFFDLLEIYGGCIIEAAKLTNRYECVRGFVSDINDYFSDIEFDYKLIFENNKIEVRQKTLNFAQKEIVESLPELFGEFGFDKVEKEFNKALRKKTRGNYEDSIRFCNMSLESTLSLMGASGKGTESMYKDLSKKLKIPQIIDNQIDLVRKQIAKIEALRSKKGQTHGGKKDYVLDNIEEVCELTINLTGSIIIYLLKLYKKKK